MRISLCRSPVYKQLGIIGTGDRGAWECYILKNIPGIDVVACCDIIPEHLENGLKEASPGAKGYSDYYKLLENHNLCDYQRSF